ncbi:MAG: hypothetical protein ACFB14_13965 [Leptolyngbyaceae cyanobacterium]
MKKIEIQFDWVPRPGLTQSERVFIQVPDFSSEEDINLSVCWAGKSHGIQTGYDLKTQDWEWWDIDQEIPDGIPFMPLGIGRLQKLAKTVATPKYTVGQIVEITPDDRNEFHPGTRGLILTVHAYNDDDDNGPYTSYTVQIADDPPGEHNDYFDGYCYDNRWTVSVFETQVNEVLV